MTYNEILECLYDLQDADKVIFKEKKFGIKKLETIMSWLYSFLIAAFTRVGFYAAKCLTTKIFPNH